MGTSNFSRGNTSKIFAVLMNVNETFKECSECGQLHYDFEYSAESFKNLSECDNECEGATLELKEEYRAVETYEIDEFKEYLRERAEEKIKNSPYYYKELDSCGRERNYTSYDLFSYNISKSYGDIEVEVSIRGQLVGAYYEGASLDFEVEFNNESYINNEPDFEWLFEYNSDMNRGLQVVHNRNAIKWANNEVEKMKVLIEEVFTEVSEPLNLVGTFSNGEAIYEKSA
jgi:hypothetical protein